MRWCRGLAAGRDAVGVEAVRCGMAVCVRLVWHPSCHGVVLRFLSVGGAVPSVACLGVGQV
eukprot:5891953-Alexandrium_andersonii.AAC.1